MSSINYSAEDISKATNGWVDNKRLQNWAARGLWLTKTTTPAPGKAKLYSRDNLCEAAVASALRMYGFKDETARGVIKHRLRTAFVRPGGGGFVSEYVARFGELPEWQGKLRYWVIAMRPSDEHWGQIASSTLGCKSRSEVAKAIDGMTYCVVFDVGKVIADAFAALKVETHARSHLHE